MYNCLEGVAVDAVVEVDSGRLAENVFFAFLGFFSHSLSFGQQSVLELHHYQNLQVMVKLAMVFAWLLFL